MATFSTPYRLSALTPLAYPAGLATVLIGLWYLATPSDLFLVTLMAVYALAALGLNIVLGMTGLLSVAQAAVMAVGGYACALLMAHTGVPFLVGLLAAAVASGVLSAFASLAAQRLSSHYFILVTLGLAEAVSLTLINEEEVTGGYNGFAGIPPLTIGGRDLSSPWAIAVVSLVVMFTGWYVVNAFRGAKIGYGARAAGADPQLAMASGVDVAKLRFLASVTGGVYAGVAGAIFAEALQFLGPGDFGLDKALLFLLIVVIGGMGSNAGTVGAAVLLTYLSQGLLHLTTVGPLVYGLGIMIILVVAPGGLASLVASARRLLRAGLRREVRG